MTTEGPLDASAPPAMAEAVSWFSRLNSGGTTDAELIAFKEWRNADQANDAAFRRVLLFRRAANEMPANEAVIRFPATRPATRRAFLVGGTVAAAAAACALVLNPPLGLWPSLEDLMADHHTGPGDRFAFAPTKGVSVEMNTRTSLALEDDGRTVKLVDGEAYFKVDQSRTDFAVRTGIVKVIGAVCAVQRQGRGRRSDRYVRNGWNYVFVKRVEPSGRRE